MDATGGFFGDLRQLALKVDGESQKLQHRMTSDKSRGTPEEATLLLHELQKEIKTLYKDVSKTLVDMKKTDSHFVELVPLCQSVVVQQAEKLANIEEYLSRYGYVAPAIRSAESVADSHTPASNCAESEPREDTAEITEEKRRVDDPSPAKENKLPPEMETPKSQMKRGSDSSEDRTPQPEDFGISLGNIMRKYADRGAKETPMQEDKSCFKIPDIPQAVPEQRSLETPQNFQHRGLCVTPGLLGPNVSSTTPANGTYVTRNREVYSFDQQVSTLTFNCDSDGSPETPILQTPALQGKIGRPECVHESEENTIALFTHGKNVSKSTVGSVKETDTWDNSPIPPILTSGVVKFATDEPKISKLKLCQSSVDDNQSPVIPVLTTPAAKKFQNKLQQSAVESSSDDNSPAVPVLLTPGVSIPRHVSRGITKSDDKAYTGGKSEESSPVFPVLQSMTDDISELELPEKPVLSCTNMSADDDIPEPPELTTINLQAFLSRTENVGKENINNASMRQAMTAVQDSDNVPREPDLAASFNLKGVHRSYSGQGTKENCPGAQQDGINEEQFPERLTMPSAEQYASLSTYITKQLSMEAIAMMTSHVNRILSEKQSAGELEEICNNDLQEYLGDKTKIFVLVMRQLGKLRIKNSGQNPTYVVS